MIGAAPMSWDMPPDAVGETVDSTRHTPHQADHTRPAEGRLRAVYPRELRAVVDLGRERVVLGRLPDDLTSPPLMHPTISRSHFVIEWDEGLQTHVGKDLNSRNGAWVNGQPAGLGWHPLAPGSVLRIGDVLLVYEAGHTLQQSDPRDVSRSNVPGDSLGVRRLRAQLARAAADISPALIVGETGTGKEKIAYELHRLSGRSGDFVAINCAALGEHLIESQLFGHVKGSFTGATSDQPGLFRAAEGGTLFLDEIGEMPLPLQPKLLRAIQEREVRAVGAHRNVTVDVRVVAATHRDLAARAHGGEFRQDLYARLALWELYIPPLRSRRSDILYWLDLLQGEWQRERAGG
ncbi:MAG: sigma-54-dependent Fis family transcriptional regulator, partial [Myxococcota bacterium]